MRPCRLILCLTFTLASRHGLTRYPSSIHHQLHPPPRPPPTGYHRSLACTSPTDLSAARSLLAPESVPEFFDRDLVLRVVDGGLLLCPPTTNAFDDGRNMHLLPRTNAWCISLGHIIIPADSPLLLPQSPAGDLYVGVVHLDR